MLNKLFYDTFLLIFVFILIVEIPVNIIRAIESSRYTILIISPTYIESMWTRMEYQIAQQNMLKFKHKIIPIIYKDITHVKNVDLNLKTMLKSITFLQWPGEGDKSERTFFWKQLKRALRSGKCDGEKRRLSSTEDITTSV